MRILIIDSNAKSNENTQFVKIIKEILYEFKLIIDNKIDYYIRNFNNIDDFLFESSLGKLNKNFGINFDSIDLIFITGSLKILPWMEKFKKILILFKMIFETKKPLFCSGCGFFGLIYLYCTNMELIKLRIINNFNEGSNLNEINKININEIEYDSAFLDNTTGNVYFLNNEKTFWENKLNVGLFKKNNLNEKIIFRNKKYNINFIKSKIIYNKEESICYIKKNYYQHWAFNNLVYDFVIPKKSKWEANSFVNYNNNIFFILAESENGIQMINFKNYPILSTKFEISNSYKSTKIIIKNFINYQIKFSNFMNHKNKIINKDTNLNNNNGFIKNNYILSNKKIKTCNFIIGGNKKKDLSRNKSVWKKNTIILDKKINKDDINFNDYKKNLESLLKKNHIKRVNFNNKKNKKKKIKISMSMYNYNIKLNKKNYEKKINLEKFKKKISNIKVNYFKIIKRKI